LLTDEKAGANGQDNSLGAKLAISNHVAQTLQARRSQPIESSGGKRGIPSYAERFKNTTVMTYTHDPDGNMVRVYGIVEYKQKTNSFDVLWDNKDEPSHYGLTLQELRNLISNSEYLDATGVIETLVAHTLVTPQSMWTEQKMLCTTDKLSIPVVIQYDTGPLNISRKDVQFGDSIIFSSELSSQLISKLLQLELVAYDDTHAYVKYTNAFADKDDVKLEHSFTRLQKTEYSELCEDYDLLPFPDTTPKGWNKWHSKYVVMDAYATDFIKYTKFLK
jgi:hypothetical protein